MHYHFIRTKVDEKELLLRKIDGESNPADFGTKIVTINKFLCCRNFLKLQEVT